MELTHLAPGGSDVGKYLGSGGFGFVFKECTTSTTPTALKIIVTNNLATSQETNSITSNATANFEQTMQLLERRVRALREYNNMAGKRHQNIVKLINCFETTYRRGEIQTWCQEVRDEERVGVFIWKGAESDLLDTIVIRMELCGPTLRMWLNYNADREVDGEICHFQVEIVIGLVEGLKFLHSCQILHRDLKPENIMFTYSPIDGVDVTQFRLPVKIGDFGLCRQMHGPESAGLSALTCMVGTAIYQAPDTYFDDYSFQADLFSLGLIFLEVLHLVPMSGRKYLFHKVVYEYKTHLIADHPLILNSKDIIVGLTRKNVETRIQHIDQVTFLLNSDAQNSGNSKQIPQSEPDCPESTMRKPWELTKLTMTLLSLVALLMLLLLVAPVVIITTRTGNGTSIDTEEFEISTKPDQTIPRNTRQVATTEELSKALSNTTVDTIQLTGSVYEVDFQISLRSKLKLKGLPFKTKIVSRITCIGCDDSHKNVITVADDCEISGLEIIVHNYNLSSHVIVLSGSRNTLHNTVLNGLNLAVVSNENYISDVTLKNIQRGLGIAVLGNGNKFTHLRMNNFGNDNLTHGVVILGNDNEFDDVISEQVDHPFIIGGGHSNKLTNIQHKCRDITPVEFDPIIIYGSSGHQISNLTCVGPNEEIPCNLALALWNNSGNVTVSNGTFKHVGVYGKNHQVSNISVLDELVIRGSYHKIVNCSAVHWKNEGLNVTILGGNCKDTNCYFR